LAIVVIDVPLPVEEQSSAIESHLPIEIDQAPFDLVKQGRLLASPGRRRDLAVPPRWLKRLN
jgi:hypothetical protein